MKFNEKLKFLRNKKTINQKTVAQALGIDRTTYTKYETGKSEPDFATVKKLADFFGVSTDYLLGREGQFNTINEAVQHRRSIGLPVDGIINEYKNADEDTKKRIREKYNVKEPNDDIPIPDDYPYKVTSRDKVQYKKHMEQLAETLFMDDETSDEDKEEIINIMNEIFWKAKLMNKRKPKKDK